MDETFSGWETAPGISTKMKLQKIHIIAFAVLALSACSIDKHEEIIDTENPMTFSNIIDGGETPLSRAASKPLDSGFMVSTYKLFGTPGMQTVMYKYEAGHTNSAGEGHRWSYVGAAGAAPLNLYQTQYERYWDLSAFPYRFNAISPCPKDAGNNLITGYELSGEKLTIPDTEIYYSQSCTDGVLNRTTEKAIAGEKIIAQVSRDALGEDLDLLLPQFNADGDVIAKYTQISSSSNLTRYVALPFHHINCKVRFAIFSEVDMSSVEEPLTINNVAITASTADDDFLYKASGFNATATYLDGDFNKRWATEGWRTLLKNTTKTYDLRNADSRANAYFFDLPNTGANAMDDGTPGGLLQIPQPGVKLNVKFSINNEHYNFPLTFTRSDSTVKTSFDWLMGCRYTYYIIIRSLYPFEIQVTATIEPWVTVKSNPIDTDLEQ